MKTALVVMAILTRLTSLDPFQVSGIDAYQTTGKIIEPLARTHPLTKELIPWLAESWTVDTATKSFRVSLRQGVKFHNGQPLTADDVKFTLEAFAKPEYKAEMWRSMWDNIASVTVIDPHTLEFQMKDLSYLTFENVMTTLRILPHAFYTPADSEKFRGQIVGTGPFQLQRFDSGRSVEVKPFAEWWGSPKPKFNLLIKTVTEPALAAQMLEKGELDYYAVPSSEGLSKLPVKSGKVRVVEATASKGEGLWIDLNMKHPLFQKREVRQALLILWDREAMNRKLFGGKYRVALDSFSAKMAYYPKGKPQPFDAKKASALLAKEGWKDSNKDSVLDKVVDGKLTDFAFTVLVNSAESERWVSLYAADAAKVGVKVHIRRLEETSQWWLTLKEGKFDAVAGQGGASESVHASTMKTGAPYNFYAYSNKDVDRGIDQLEKTFDIKKRHALERGLIAKVRGDIAQLPGLFAPGEKILLSQRLHIDLEFPGHAWAWRLKH